MRIWLARHRAILAAFVISCLAHAAALIAGREAVAPPGAPGDDIVCAFTIGSVRGMDDPIPSDAPSLPAPDRDAGANRASPSRDSAPEEDRGVETDDATSLSCPPGLRPDIPAAVNDISPAHRDREAGASLPPMAASPPSRGEDGRTSQATGGEDEYFDTIRRRISEMKQFPAEALNEGSRGTSLVGFRLYRDGTVSDVRLARSSRSPILDTEAQGTVRRAAPFFPIPDRFDRETMDLQVPISFEIGKPR